MQIGPLCSFQLKPQVATTRLTAKAAAVNALKIYPENHLEKLQEEHKPAPVLWMGAAALCACG